MSTEVKQFPSLPETLDPSNMRISLVLSSSAARLSHLWKKLLIIKFEEKLKSISINVKRDVATERIHFQKCI